MNAPDKYCANTWLKFPYFEDCQIISDWGYIWQISGIIFGFIIGLFTVYQIICNLRQIKDSTKENSKINSANFFLQQHRRLFEDSDLKDVLQYIDSDDATLANEAMWDKKRKMLTYFEEIEILTRSGIISRDLSSYIFGYYVLKCRNGNNFNKGIIMDDKNYGVFLDFAHECEYFFSKIPENPHERVKYFKNIKI